MYAMLGDKPENTKPLPRDEPTGFSLYPNPKAIRRYIMLVMRLFSYQVFLVERGKFPVLPNFAKFSYFYRIDAQDSLESFLKMGLSTT